MQNAQILAKQQFMTNVLKLETDRLVLRPISERDVPAYEKHFVDYDVIRHLSRKTPWPYPDNGVYEYVTEHIIPSQGNDRWYWGIYLKNRNDELVGGIELWRPGNPENRGFWLGKSHWGNGYMTEAVIPVIDIAFNELGFSILVFSNAKGNDRSGRVKEKTQARYIRTEPFSFVDPVYTEREIWELTKQEWMSRIAASM